LEELSEEFTCQFGQETYQDPIMNL